ncbi:MAG: CapA family protein [Candidatus Colwellbacteria bacterium]|nr:CapA family protein [Candidatus Colwellbacteria bacterium]
MQSALTRIWIDYEAKLVELKGVSILFVGDIMLSRNVGRKMEELGDYRYPFLESADILREADLTLGNLEGPISARGVDQGSQYSFRADPKVIKGLIFAGFDALVIANNHIWDWGGDALSDTVTLLQEDGIEPMGAGRNYEEANKPVIEKIGTSSVAILAYTDLYPNSLKATEQTPGISDFNVEGVQGLISELKDEVDIIVINLHWGEEYADGPSSAQRVIARSFIDAGADLIIGHHPHVVQETEAYKNGWIAYSLGNFVFDQNFSAETMEGLAVRANIRGGSVVSVEQFQVKISNSFQPAIVKL